MKIRKGDKVIVLKGKDKGKTAPVVRVLAEQGKVVLEGLNLAKKHEKSRERGKKGSIVDAPMPIDASNVAVVDSKGKPTRVGFKVEGGKKSRIARKTGEVIK